MGSIEEYPHKEFSSIELRSARITAGYFAAGHAVNPSMGAQSPRPTAMDGGSAENAGAIHRPGGSWSCIEAPHIAPLISQKRYESALYYYAGSVLLSPERNH